MTLVAGKEYQTREGRSARCLATDLTNVNGGSCAVEVFISGVGDILRYYPDGRYYHNLESHGDHRLDLFEIPKTTQTFGLSIYRNEVSSVIWTTDHPTREKADQFAKGLSKFHKRVAYKEITFTDGEGLDGAR